jgi:hypothetical protein
MTQRGSGKATPTATSSPIASVRALSADNAKKLEKKTLRQVAAMPGPAMATAKTTAVTLAPTQEGYYTISCDAGTAAISGGYSTSAPVLALDTHPLDTSTWRLYLVNLDTAASAAVTTYVVCLDVADDASTFRAPALADEHAMRILPRLPAPGRQA